MASETNVAEPHIKYPTLQGPIKYGEFHPRDTILETAKAGAASAAVGLVLALAKGNLSSSSTIAGGLRRNMGTAVLFSKFVCCLARSVLISHPGVTSFRGFKLDSRYRISRINVDSCVVTILNRCLRLCRPT
jgi:hypothetical protein